MLRTLKYTALLLVILSSTSFGGIRGAGKYSGVVIFDGWGGCTLYSGVYVMYISEDVKEQLRPYANEAVQLNATDVFQPMNPGDGLIKGFDSVEHQSGPGKQPFGVWLGGVQLKNLIACKNGQKPAVQMQIVNTAQRPIEIRSGELAPTLLMKQKAGGFSPSDGPSAALITRQNFWMGGDEKPGWRGGGVRHGTEYKWTIGKENALPRVLKLQPGEKKRIKITFDLPPGEYEFLSGYGGGVHAGKCIAGNRVAFDVDENGLAKRPSVGPIEAWLVNNDLSQEIIDQRDQLLQKADEEIRTGLLQLAETNPRLKKGVGFKATVSEQSGTGRISIYLGHRGLRMDEDPFLVEDRFQVWISLHGPPNQVSQVALAPLYPNLGLVGTKRVMAREPELEAELKKLVKNALEPLAEFNESLNIADSTHKCN